MRQEKGWQQRVKVLLEKRYEESRKEKQELISKLQGYTREEEKHIVFFGCGVQGQVLYYILAKKGITPDYYCDNKETLWGEEIVEDKICISPAELKELSDVVVLLTVGLGYANIIYEQLKEAGIDNIIKFPIDSLHLYSTSIYDFSMEEIISNMSMLLELLSDEQSREIAYTKLYVMMASLEEMNLFDYSDIYTEPQYYPSDIIRLSDGEVIVEGGSYVGDSLQYLIEELHHEAFGNYYCFELDKDNYLQLNKYVQTLPERLKSKIQTINAGIGSRNEKIPYSSVGEGSNILDWIESDSKAQIVALDKELEGEKVTFIKMDIEGSEIDALLGSRQIIQKYVPKLAICVYHKPEHLWEVPFLIHKFNASYKIFLRHHTLITTDTVCYAT